MRHADYGLRNTDYESLRQPVYGLRTTASESIGYTPPMTSRAAIVVEGGAMRGVFAAGVLDVFLGQRFD